MHEERYDDDDDRDHNSVNDDGERARACIAVKPLKGRRGVLQQLSACPELAQFRAMYCMMHVDEGYTFTNGKKLCLLERSIPLFQQNQLTSFCSLGTDVSLTQI